MKLERIVNRIGNFTRTAVASGLLGLGILGAWSMPAYSQQKEKYSANKVNVNYVPCTSQETRTPQKTTASVGKDTAKGEVLTLLGLMVGMEKPNNPDAQKLGTVLSTLGVMEHQKEVAREGRSQVNINQGEQNRGLEGGELEKYLPAPGCAWVNPGDPDDLTVRKSIGMAFAANSWKDLNYNGRFSLDEFVGVKDRFYDNENMILVLYNQVDQKKGWVLEKEVKWEIYGPKGDKILEDSMTTEWEMICLGANVNLMDVLLKNSGYGNYVIVWRSKGITEMTKFEIVPASERPEKR